MDVAKQPTSDTWLTTKIKADILTERGLPGGDIKVETKDGVVNLSSDVTITEGQKQLAVSIAKKIKGVRHVTADGLETD
jgi:hyperosmotically inducible protein